ncbi:Ig-like domain-containing protein, partial [Sagittula sp. SSi028]|uniref:Ig-like domain-containing protein n=1 Tax=Sagittula sp. SSi028 TaxID=3400636 RepID=UPI003AF96EC9
PNFDGTVSIDYTVTDGDVVDAEVASATMTIAVNPIPGVTGDLRATDEDTPVALGILPNDDPGDGIATVDILTLPTAEEGTLTYIDAAGVTQAVTTPASLTAAEAATLTFVPAEDFNTAGRPPIAFTYAITDTTGDQSAPATVSVTVAAIPDATGDAVTERAPGPVRIDVLANDTASADDTLDPASVRLVAVVEDSVLSSDGRTLTVAGEGRWSVDPADGSITFTPVSDFTYDPTEISYTVADITGDRSDPARVSVDYRPVAQPDIQRADPGTRVVIGVLGNDTTGDRPLPETVQIVGTNAPGQSLLVPGEGEWDVDPATGAISFTPLDGVNSDPTPIFYVSRDSSGQLSNQAKVTIEYRPTGTIAPHGHPEPEAHHIIVEESPTLSVSPIVDITANLIGSLGSAPRLEAERPILSAVNSISSLDGVRILPTEDLIYFTSLSAPFPITIAIEGIDPGTVLSELMPDGGDILKKLQTFFPKGGTGMHSYILTGVNYTLLLTASFTAEGATCAIFGGEALEKLHPVSAVLFGEGGAKCPDSVKQISDGIFLIAPEGEKPVHLRLAAELQGTVDLDLDLGIHHADRIFSIESRPLVDTSTFTDKIATIANEIDSEIGALANGLSL